MVGHIYENTINEITTLLNNSSTYLLNPNTIQLALSSLDSKSDMVNYPIAPLIVWIFIQIIVLPLIRTSYVCDLLGFRLC